jgi:putative oxidoreductase
MREIVYLVGRILFGLVFIQYGFNHLVKTDGSAQYAAYKKVPSPRLAVQVSGVAMLVGAMAVVLGIWVDLAGLGLAILVVIMAFAMHRYWEETDPQSKAIEQAAFLKNISMAGCGLILAAIGFIDFYTLTDGVFQP